MPGMYTGRPRRKTKKPVQGETKTMIPGVTDRPRLPRLGKIRLGTKAKSQSGKEYPKALDHFNFTDVPEVEEIYGKECRELPVILPADDPNVFFPTARKAYRKCGLFCACDDGETAHRVFVKEDKQGMAFLESEGRVVKDGAFYEMPCPGESCNYFENKMCKNLGRLLFILPDVPRFGVYEIATTSYNSIVNLMSMTDAIRNAVGTVSGVPLHLLLKPMQVQPDGKAKTVYVLELEYRGSYQQLAGVGLKIRAAGGGAAALLAPPEGDMPDDLYPHAAQALDAELGDGKAAVPEGDGRPPAIAGKVNGGGNGEPEMKPHPSGCLCVQCERERDIPL